MIKNEREKKLRELEKFTNLFKALGRRESLAILMTIEDSGDLSYHALYQEMQRYFGKKYNTNQLWRTLKILEEEKLLINQKRLEINPKTGKARNSFYGLAMRGKNLLNDFLVAINKHPVE